MTEPTFIIHDLSHALAVGKGSMALNAPVVVRSAPGLATTLGPEAFSALIEETDRVYPDALLLGVLDCGDQAGTAIGALRRGVKRICIDPDMPTGDKIDDIARQLDAEVVNCSDNALDLLDVEDMDRAVFQHITNGTPS